MLDEMYPGFISHLPPWKRLPVKGASMTICCDRFKQKTKNKKRTFWNAFFFVNVELMHFTFTSDP